MSKKYILKESHPLFEKYSELCKIMDSMNLQLRIGYKGFHIMDTETGVDCLIEDIENYNVGSTEFPPFSESKLSFSEDDVE